MRTPRLILTLVLVGIGSAPAALLARAPSLDAPIVWAIDPARSVVEFTVTKLGFSDVTGVFSDSDGQIRYEAAAPALSSVRWRARVGSVRTEATNRDRALQSADYFDSARHPYIEFVSRSVRALETDRLEVEGDLTMRGVTHPITVIVARRIDAGLPRFETAFEVDRYAYGIAGGSIMGRLIGRTASIRLVAVARPPAEAQDVEFIRALERAQRDKPRSLSSRARIAPEGEPGTPLVVEGRLFRADGRTPAPGMTVFAYHTDRTGVYNERSAGPHSWRLRGWALTDAEGRFEFRTIRPAPYPGRTEAAHIHISIEGPGLPRRLSAGIQFADDELVTASDRAASARAGAFGDVRPVSVREGVQYVQYLVRIAEEGRF